MLVHGGDCSIVIKTSHTEIAIPYSSETIREAVVMLYEEAAIEGEGTVRAIRKSVGATGCVITPLSIGTVTFLLSLAMGSVGSPLFVSETRNLYRNSLTLLPMEDSDCFDMIQDRGTMGGERRIYQDCRVKIFELRIERCQAIKLKLDMIGKYPPAVYQYTNSHTHEQGERFYGDNVVYQINSKGYKNIYGLTLISQKENGTKTEVWIRRSLVQGNDIPEIIDELTITAKLLRDTYEERQYGTFSIIVKNLVLVSDETEIETAGAVIGPLRFYIFGEVTATVYTSGQEVLL
jgi:hypothetical protein